MALPWFALSAASSFCVALAFYPALRLPERRRFFVLLFLQLLILLSPLAIPANARFLRLLGSIGAITFTLKLYDLHIGAAVGARPALPRFVVFLWNVFSLVDRRIDTHPDRPWPSPAARLVSSTAATLAALALAYAVFRFDWTRWPSALEHAAKVVSFFLELFPFTAAIAVIWRLFLGPARDHIRNPFAARTPADFWRRYNRPTHEFLEEDVFKPAAGSRRGRGGRWAGLGAIVLTFLLSAVAHEYVFAVPIGRCAARRGPPNSRGTGLHRFSPWGMGPVGWELEDVAPGRSSALLAGAAGTTGRRQRTGGRAHGGRAHHAVAVGQVTPGPLLTTATFVGYVLGRSAYGTAGAVAGALLATVAIFLPAFVFVAALGKVLPRLSRSPVARGALDAASAAVVALIVVVTLTLAASALRTPTSLAVAAAAAVALLAFKVNATWVMLAAALVGTASGLWLWT